MIGAIANLFRPLLLFQVPAPKIPDFVEKYKKLSKKARMISETISVHHAKAYSDAAEKHLKDKEGYIDYEKLEDFDLRQKFADEIAEFYRTQARKILKSGVKPEDEFENELLVNAMYGTTRAQLRQLVQQYGKNYKLGLHLKAQQKAEKAIAQRLQQVSLGHITEKHIDDIIKYTQVEKSAGDLGFDFRKENLQLPQAINLMAQYADQGALSRGYLEQIGPPYFRKKKKSS